jgi:UDP-perosamine 4-acetyltransferase
MNTPLIIIGAGGHARVALEALLCSTSSILGLLDTNEANHGARVLGLSVLGGDDVLSRYPAGTVHLVNGIGSVRDLTHRLSIYEYFKVRGYSFASVIHPSAIVARDVTIGEGAHIMAGAILQPGVKIGCNTIVNTAASVDHDCIVGDHAHLAPGVVLSGNVVIGDHTHVGTGATIIQGVVVGRGAMIGAGAVVVRDIPPHVTAMGVPAKVVK